MSKEPFLVIGSGIASDREVLRLLNSDDRANLGRVTELENVLRRALKFYDTINRPHDPGEAELLDEMSRVLACRTSTVFGDVSKGGAT